MRAVVCSRYRSPDRLEVREVDQSRPGDGEVLVRVQATTVNRTDAATLRGKPRFARIATGLETVEVGADDHVLVYGATGAIGSAAVQLPKHRDVSVTAVCGARGMDLVTSLGADVVIDHTAGDFTQTEM